VQIAVSATNESVPVWATRKPPEDVSTSAAAPTLASGEPASTVKEIVLLTTGALMRGRAGVDDPEGDVGLPPPPQASTIPATVRRDRVWQL